MVRSPLVIVGTGGSGTRVFARLAEAAGHYMGVLQNESNDALAFYTLARSWCPEIYAAWRDGGNMDFSGFGAALRPCVAAHLAEAPPGRPWGWKQPRSLYLLPVLRAALPQMLVVHVVRDGRDIAFGAQWRLDAMAYAVPKEADGQPPETRLALLWEEPNRLAADFGETRLGEHYLRLRLEDLCAEPEATAARLTSFIEGESIPAERVRSIVETPASLGRWRERDTAMAKEVQRTAAAGLERFGYLDGSSR